MSEFPDNVLIIGGGRWARVLTEVLCELVSSSVNIYIYSPHNAGSMSEWALAKGFGRKIQVSTEWPQFSPSESGAAIVANAARDHESAVERSLLADIPVLVEKPVALTASAVHRLINIANCRGTYLAAAHIFLFAGYIENYSRLLINKDIRELRVIWIDPLSENRYGEVKSYDPGLPVYADWLPHILSILGTLTTDQTYSCKKTQVLRGGAHLELEFMLGNTPCNIRMIRNGGRRQRTIEAATDNNLYKLDFSMEPGTIMAASKAICGDPEWENKHRPAARMLLAFLEGASGGVLDSRLNVEIGLHASQVIDHVSGLYSSALMSWLIKDLSSQALIDEELNYALREILQSEGTLPSKIIDQQIERVHSLLCGVDSKYWLSALSEAQDPFLLLKEIGSGV